MDTKEKETLKWICYTARDYVKKRPFCTVKMLYHKLTMNKKLDTSSVYYKIAKRVKAHIDQVYNFCDLSMDSFDYYRDKLYKEMIDNGFSERKAQDWCYERKKSLYVSAF